jgi:twitching motility protein PilT
MRLDRCGAKKVKAASVRPIFGLTDTTTQRQGVNETPTTLDGLLTKLIDLGGSDLHLKVGSPPAFRVSGKLTIGDLAVLDAVTTRSYADELMSEGVRKVLDQTGDADVAFGRPALGRFRANIYRQRGSVNIAIRSMRTASYSFESLGLPRALEEICRSESGLVLVAGGAGSGKTTTLAAMLDHINATRRINIVTLEDPIEVVHTDKMSLVSQREIGLDTPSFGVGLRTALRQDPDAIYVSELRDRETAEAAISAAQTGHLVLASMLASDVVDVLDKLTELFPSDEHDRVRRALGSTVKAVLALRLMNRADGQGRVPAVESLVNVDRAGESIAREPRAPKLRDVIADGAYFGMQTFDQALLKLQQKNLVSFQDALTAASDPTDFKLAVQTMGLRSA